VSRAERLFGLAQFLRSTTGRSLPEIARRFSVSERTVFRDLASLDEQGVPIEHLDEGRYRILDDRHRQPSLDSTDLALVRASLPPSVGADDSPIASRVARLIQKVEDALRGRGRVSPHIGAAAEEIPRDPNREMLRKLIRQRRSVLILYRSISGGTESERGVDPWQLFERGDAWYLVGRCHQNDEPRLFRLDRIRSVRAAQGSFRVPRGFDLARFLADAWRTLVLGTPPERKDRGARRR
jgi:predicted DNA-binding transcriptional regulator YafY